MGFFLKNCPFCEVTATNNFFWTIFLMGENFDFPKKPKKVENLKICQKL